MTLSSAFWAVLALLVVYALVLGVILAGTLLRGMSRRTKIDATNRVLPQVREALVDYLSGSNDRSRLDEFAQRHRAALEAALLAFQGSAGGSARDRLCALALDVGLVRQWTEGTRSRDVMRRRACFARLAFVSSFEPCRRISAEVLQQAIADPDAEVRLAAARGLLHTGDTSLVERVFHMAISESLLMRVLLTEDLRRHAVTLSQRAIPEVLRGVDPGRLAAALEMLAAWERVIPVTDLGDLLEHIDPRVRLQAIRLAPLVAAQARHQRSILTALDDPDPELRLAAAHASARISLLAAMPALARSLRLGPARSARAAAAALAEMPPRGWETLEELSAGPNQVTAAAAREALARIHRRVLV